MLVLICLIPIFFISKLLNFIACYKIYYSIIQLYLNVNESCSGHKTNKIIKNK